MRLLSFMLLGYSPDFRTKSCFSKAHRLTVCYCISQRKQGDYRWADGNFCLSFSEHMRTTSTQVWESLPGELCSQTERDSDVKTRFVSLQRGQPWAVQIVGGVFHDHPICQGLGVWLAFWLQFFSGDCLGPWLWITHSGRMGTQDPAGVVLRKKTCFLLWKIIAGHFLSCVSCCLKV